MALFGRRHREAELEPDREGLAQAAASLGLHPVDDDDHGFNSSLLDRIKEASRVIHGFPPRTPSTMGDVLIPNMFFAEVFTGTIDGRAITVANVRTPMETASLRYSAKVHGTSLVVVELTTVVPYSVQPRMKQGLHGREIPTGDAAFDAAFQVLGFIALGESPFASSEVRQRIAAHNDWIFVFDGPTLACVGREGFVEGDELTDRVQEAIGVVKAIPESVAPSTVDHSFDDLLVRIGELDSVDDAIAFLATITPEDRDRLAHSPTPLAKFADVKTPDEITERFMSLDMNERLQILAMFDKTQ